MKKKILFFINFIIVIFLFSEERQNNKSFIKKLSIFDSKYSFYLQDENTQYSIIKNNNDYMEKTTFNNFPLLIKKQVVDDKSVFDFLDHSEPLFLKKTTFFSNYFNSNLYKQLEDTRLKNTTSFICDINNDNEDELLIFGYPYTGSNPSGLSIYKYNNNSWREIFSECYFGWNDFFSDQNFSTEEWYAEKKFPYDFVEYKGKIGLRIICYDQPKDWPSQYHAQFWYFDSVTQKYEMLEEIWNTEEDTPLDGLIFAEAKTELFSKKELDFSKLDSKLTEADLKDLDKAQLRLMRNAVYARHGRTFKSVDLQSLWECYTWYKKNPNYSDALLTDIDKYNIELIQKYEAK